MKWGKWIAYGIAILAVIGLVGQLIINPGGFLRNMLMMIGVAVIVGFLLYFFLVRRRSNVSSGYKKALKQSKQMYGKSGAKVKPNMKAKTGGQSKLQRMPRIKKDQAINQSCALLKVIKNNNMLATCNTTSMIATITLASGLLKKSKARVSFCHLASDF